MKAILLAAWRICIRSTLSRGFASAVAILAVMTLMPAARATTKPVTWIVIDAANGHVLSEHGADSLNYPASLTKMMTLYLTFGALERHQISLNTRFTVSRHAASMEPSKLGLRPGQSISVHDLILGIVTKSANDAAVVLAEGLAGSEPAFAVQMNREARALGMLSTNFRNASGLPNRYNYSTARDMAKLALALYRNFRQDYHYFSTETFTYDGRTYLNHNHLMEAFKGMDGIKTGYINASGFNLAASAVRNGRRLIGVIMGGRTARSRDSEMAELLDDAFAHREVPASMIASAKPITFPHRRHERHDSVFRRAANELSPIARAEAATSGHHRLASASHTLARHHYRHHIRIARRHHHATRHRRLASAARHIVHHRRVTHVARVHHVTHAHRYAARHYHRRHLARLHHHRVIKRRYARLRRNHAAMPHRFAKPVYETRNWVCSNWAKAHHRCPGHKLTLPRDAAMRSADNSRNGSGSSS